MDKFYFIINKKEYVLIVAESESMAIEVFKKLSLAKYYQVITGEKPKGDIKLTELIKQRKTT